VTVHCGISRRQGNEYVPCGAWAVVIFRAPDRAIGACAEHVEKARRWVSYSGRNTVSEQWIGPKQEQLF
jgi:hypothetical protein